MARALRVIRTTQGCCHKGGDRSAFVVSTLKADSLLSTPTSPIGVCPLYGLNLPQADCPLPTHPLAATVSG